MYKDEIMEKKKYYVVKRGRTPGVYYSWAECEAEVKGFAGAVFKGFVHREEAEAWYGKKIEEAASSGISRISRAKKNEPKDIEKLTLLYPPHVKEWKEGIIAYGLPYELTIYTDGSCLVNPDGPGGFAAVFLSGGEKILTVTGGEPSSTNNRMELRAAYEALKILGGISHKITFHTDSKYLQQAFTQGWVRKWKRNGWKTVQNTDVLNKDLWTGLDRLMDGQIIQFEWVKGHAGTEYNELCDVLAKKEAMVFRKK